MRDAILVEEWVNLQARLPHMPGMSRMIPVKRMIEFVSSCLQAALVSHSSPKNKGQGNATDCVDSEHKEAWPSNDGDSASSGEHPFRCVTSRFRQRLRMRAVQSDLLFGRNFVT
jgi:hypothetical protein